MPRKTEAFYKTYTIAVERYMRDYPSCREGQSYFNVLYFDRFDPEYANKVRGSALDPFYDNGRISDFLAALRRYWELDARD